MKCVYIDPPYNTGNAFEQYDDGLEHSIWLSLMRDRLELLLRLLSDEGSIWVSMDDNEAHYLKVMMDEIFGRRNFVATIIWQKIHARNNTAIHFSADHDFKLVYAKNIDVWKSNNLLPVPVLSQLFRGKMLAMLKAAHEAGRLQFFGPHAELADRRTFKAWLDPLYDTKWHVYAKRPFAGPEAVLAYLARYTHRVAISNSRLISLNETGVT